MDKWKDKLASQAKESYKGNKKFQKKALETIYKYYPEFGREKSQNKAKGALNGEKIIILTGNFNSLVGIFMAILFTFFSVILLIVLPFVDLEAVYGKPFDFELTGLQLWIIIITLIMIFFGCVGWWIIFTLQSKFFFIILDFQGIYYKKITKPRLLAWTDISKITAKKKYNMKYRTLNSIIVKIYLTPKGKVRFRSGYYRGNLWRGRKSPKFAETFELFRYRKCPFFYYSRR